MTLGTAKIIQGNALHLPLADNTVDLCVTSPPYFGLRSYQDGGEHYAGQLGAEATPAEFVDALIAATREMIRVTKPTGSIWVNLGDKYAGSGMGGNTSLANSDNYLDQRAKGYSTCKENATKDADVAASDGSTARESNVQTNAPVPVASTNGRKKDLGPIRSKSLIGIPWRFALRCIDDLGLILRAEVIWHKPGGLPESVRDRVRRNHETWFHFVLNPRYYAAVDEIRESYESNESLTRTKGKSMNGGTASGSPTTCIGIQNALGKLPGSVWTINTQPLIVPPELGIDHFAAFPMEFPRRIIQGWSPAAICTVCDEGRRPVGDKDRQPTQRIHNGTGFMSPDHGGRDSLPHRTTFTLTGYACACPEPTAATVPSVILDPFGGTGTTALMAKALGRTGISVDMSADYCRLATWRTTDPRQLATALEVEKPDAVASDQLELDLFGTVA